MMKVVLGYGIQGLAWLLGMGMLLGIGIVYNMRSLGIEKYLVIGLLGGAGAFAVYLYQLGQRLTNRDAAEVLEKDTRRPVLLLRSFKDDGMQVSSVHNKNFLIFGQIPDTFEQMLQRAFSKVGPVIAIGRPGEVVAPLGAARLWVDFASWQQRLDGLLEECRQIVMVMGDLNEDAGLAGEFNKLLQLDQPEKIFLVVPPVSEGEASKRWSKFREESEGKLPPYLGGELLVTFGPDWTPYVARSQKGFFGGYTRDEMAYKAYPPVQVDRTTGKPVSLSS